MMTPTITTGVGGDGERQPNPWTCADEYELVGEPFTGLGGCELIVLTRKPSASPTMTASHG
jgi:hypothetical protein